MPNGLSGGCSSENYIWTWKGRGVNSALQQLYSEQPSKNGSNKKITDKGAMGPDFDPFWIFCILSIFCIYSAYFAYCAQYLCTTPFWCKYFTTFVTFSITARASRSEKNFCLHTKETSLNKQVNIWSSCFTLEFCPILSNFVLFCLILSYFV